MVSEHILIFVQRCFTCDQDSFYSAFTETGATQTMKTNQMAELKQKNIFKSI